jgi:hypothetical protein
MASIQKLDTILYEVQQASLQMSLPAPIGVYDSQDENALLMGSVANLAGILVAEAYDWQQLREPFSLTGDGVTTAFDLPADFSRFVDGTGWSYAMRRPVVVVDAQQWARAKAWIPKLIVNPVCRIFADQLQFLVAPMTGEVITFEYVDANWVIDADDTTILKQRASKNADMPRFDWLLMTLAIKVKWLEQKGMSTVAAQSDFNDRMAILLGHDKMAQPLTLSGPSPMGYRYLDGVSNVPDTGFGM